MDDIYKLARQFENRLKTCLDLPNSQSGRWFREEAIKLLDDIETNRKPLSIENRIKIIKQQLENLEDDNLMDHSDQDDLIDRCDDLIQRFRKLS
jgi:hypothetical protein